MFFNNCFGGSIATAKLVWRSKGNFQESVLSYHVGSAARLKSSKWLLCSEPSWGPYILLLWGSLSIQGCFTWFLMNFSDFHIFFSLFGNLLFLSWFPFILFVLVSVPCQWGIPGSLMLDFPGLELETVLSHCVGAGNETQVLWKSSQALNCCAIFLAPCAIFVFRSFPCSFIPVLCIHRYFALSDHKKRISFSILKK